MNKTTFIKNLYQVVDNKSVADLSNYLADNVNFRLANFDAVIGKQAVLEANQTFFSSITTMAHRIDNVWQQEEDIICNGRVDYIRLDGSKFSANFSTILKLQSDKIINYLIYADISQL